MRTFALKMMQQNVLPRPAAWDSIQRPLAPRWIKGKNMDGKGRERIQKIMKRCLHLPK